MITRLGVDSWDRAVDVLQRRGALAVFLTRLVPVIRTLVPVAAGVARVRYPSFLLASFAGSATWAAIYVGGGFLLRSSLETVQKTLGSASNVLLIVVLVGIVGAIAYRLLRKRLTIGGSGLDTQESPPRQSLVDRHFLETDWWTWPNLITAIRLLLLPLFVWMISTRMLWAAILILGVIFLADWFDGWLARRSGSVSALGTWLDPVAGRITVLVTVGAFALGHLVPWETVVLLAIPDLLLGIAAFAVFKGDPNLRATVIGKVRTVLIFTGLLGILLGTALRESVADRFAGLVGLSFVLVLFGLVGHYIAAVQYARGMIAEKPLMRKPHGEREVLGPLA